MNFLRSISNSISYAVTRLLRQFSNRPIGIYVDAETNFHFQHAKPLIIALQQSGQFEIYCSCKDGLHELRNQSNVRFLSYRKFWHSWFSSIEVFLTTEVGRRPSWLIQATSICVFHGAGPKMNYVLDKELKNYDMVFSAGPYTYQKQIRQFKNKPIVVKVGLPILDRFSSYSKSNIKFHDRNNDRISILYAPSWSINDAEITLDHEILSALADLDDFEVILRPHPAFFDVNRCRVNWKPEFNRLMRLGIIFSDSRTESVYDLMPKIDILITDFSSLLFEFLTFNRPIVVYQKNGVLESMGGADFAQPINSACYVISKANALKSTLRQILFDDYKQQERIELLANSLYPIGDATDRAVKAIFSAAGVNCELLAKKT